ncbi:uncharacterized protein LOC130212031 [Pseudoliparis swirei]|uniref:uncharacterized protein LOC130212031 n=1 Tax=Pseudoliparis swirei TaxID=2059687 RepID=UPI0024BE7947|nr:uncharacterized protein LOC130212031 [Pseudoliparis swirei]
MSCRMLLLLFIPLLFILPSCVCGPFVVNVTQSSYQAEENHSVTLEWTFTTNTERPSDSPDVFCKLFTDIRPFNMLYVLKGVQIPDTQDERFAGRVQWDQDLLRGGRVRLHVSRLRTSDSGQYACGVLTSYGMNSETCWLNVSAVRDRPETNGPDGGRDSSGTESRPQPESRGRIVLYCVLMTALLVLLVLLLSGLIRSPTHERGVLCAAIKELKFLKREPKRTDRPLPGGPPLEQVLSEEGLPSRSSVRDVSVRENSANLLLERC